MHPLILQNYFKGIASEKEEALILEWVEASEANKNAFLKERMLYDISLFADRKKPANATGKSRIIRLFRWGLRVAVLIWVAFSGILFIKEYKRDRTENGQIITVTAGQRAEVLLADGSKVWLNAKSTLTGMTGFGQKNRNVELNGEAYFEVAKNTQMPFVVITEHNRIQVTGTQFNVSAYKGSRTFETAVVEGSVNIYSRETDEIITKLTENQVIIARDNKYRKEQLQSHEALRWREGLYCFDDTPFKVLLEKLENYYGVSIILGQTAPTEYKCTGKFRESDGIEHILNVIRKDHPFSYTINKSCDTIQIR
jgi:ferric-dicitrate binding protein FerR (iron transport regulator)